MMTKLLFASADGGSLSVGDKFSLSLTTLLLGMLVVFAVLLLIMFVIMIVGKVFQSTEKKKKASPPEKQDVPAPAAAEAETEQADDAELVAAITAAVAVCLEADPGSFRVVSFRKTTAKPAWNKK
ncbi:MAG: OadG family protein [Clostridia bacterium]|nr:OadG family protein [Clostridia bacterium]